MTILSNWEFTALPNLHIESKALLSQLLLGVLLCPPDGSVAPEDRAGERRELEFFDVEEAELHSDHPDGTFSRLSENRASSSSSSNGNTRGSQGV